jgi:hypothetical protein
MWGNRTKGINIFSVLAKCIHVWFDLARGNFWLIRRVIAVFWTWCDGDNQWLLNYEGNIFEIRSFTLAQLNFFALYFRITDQPRGLLVRVSGY